MDGMERFLIEGNISSYMEKLQQEERVATRALLKDLLLLEARRFAEAAERQDCIERLVVECNLKIAQQKSRMLAAREAGADMQNVYRLMNNLVDIRSTLLALKELAPEALDQWPVGEGDNRRS